MLSKIYTILFPVIFLISLPVGATFAQINFTEHTVGQLGEASSVYAVDLDTDGDVDILGSGYEVRQIACWLNDGDQEFSFDVIAAGFNGAVSVHAADINADGNLDVIAGATNDGSIRWWAGDGEGNFNENVITNNFRTVRAIYPVDLDSDGDVDVLGASYSNHVINWWENDGNGNFSEQSVGANYARANSVYAVDIDSDGDIDVISGSGWGEEVAVWWENNGNEQFQRNNLNGGAASVVYAEDIDSDGDMDILGGAQYSDAFYWWENNGEGDPEFQVHMISDQVNDPAGLSVADLDADGDNDLLCAVWAEGTFKWWENDGDEQFREILISDSLNGACSIQALDIDADGDLDVVGAARGASDRILWWESDLAEDEPVPPDTCDLVSPANDSVLADLSMQLNWTRVNGPDEEVIITYQPQWSATEDFAGFEMQDTENDTFFVFENLEDDSDYWWRVQATDPNTELTSISNQTWHFITSMPEPPSPFNLLTPENEVIISVDDSRNTSMSWELSVDPDPGDTTQYDTYILITGLDEPISLQFLNLIETSISIDYPEILLRSDIEYWEESLLVNWYVETISGADTIDCNSEFSFRIEANSGVPSGPSGSVIKDFEILSTYPNPFNSSTSIRYSLPVSSEVSISLFDLNGCRVTNLLNGWKSTGMHVAAIEAATLPAGLYIVRLEANEMLLLQKVAVIK